MDKEEGKKGEMKEEREITVLQKFKPRHSGIPKHLTSILFIYFLFLSNPIFYWAFPSCLCFSTGRYYVNLLDT